MCCWRCIDDRDDTLSVEDKGVEVKGNVVYEDVLLLIVAWRIKVEEM